MEPFELITNRLSGSNHRVEIEKLIKNCRTELRCIMPFISRDGINFFKKSLEKRVYRDKIKIKLIICDSPQAYRSKTLDLNSISELIEQYDLEISAFGDGLHAKVFLKDNSLAIVTSANLTEPGLSGNLEIGVKITDEKVLGQLSNEFETAWKAAEQLSLDDIKERLAWINDQKPQIQEEKASFRGKIRWKPVVTSGTGDSWGIGIFQGFKEEDFIILDPGRYGGSFHDDPVDSKIVQKIQESIESQTNPLLRKFYLAVKDYLPKKEFLFPHYASRRRVKNFYPSATWLGFGRNEKKYVTLAQLAVGLFVDEDGKGLFTSFNIGEEYQINEDKSFFLNWLNKNIPLFVKMISNLNSNFSLNYSHPQEGWIEQSVKEINEEDLKKIISISRDHLLDFHIERKYIFDEEEDLLGRSSIILEVVSQFEVLYPIYVESFKK